MAHRGFTKKIYGTCMSRKNMAASRSSNLLQIFHGVGVLFPIQKVRCGLNGCE